MTRTYDIISDLHRCIQISISFQDGRDCLIRKVKNDTFSVEMDNPHNEYPYMSAEAIMRMLPCSGITEYKVSLPDELPAGRAMIAKSLFPKLCSPAVKTVKMSTKLDSVFACKLTDGNWMMNNRKCSIVEVVHALKQCMNTPLEVQFSINDKTPVKI